MEQLISTPIRVLERVLGLRLSIVLKTQVLALQQTRQAVILQVKQGCFELLMAEKILKVDESSDVALAAHETDVRTFHATGLVPLNDLL